MRDEITTLSGADFTAEIRRSGEPVMRLTMTDGSTFTLGGADFGSCREAAGVTRRMRMHRTGDRLAVTTETERTVPFGCEYRVDRRLEIVDGCLVATVDVRAGGGGAVEDFRLDPVEFTGDWKRIGIGGDDGRIEWFDAPGTPGTLFFGPVMPLRIIAESTGGALLETACGGDLWRHRTAAESGLAEISVVADRRRVRLERRLLAFAPESVIPRRPWRFQYLVGWTLPGAPARPAAEALDAARLAAPESGRRRTADGQDRSAYCLTAGAVFRRLQEQVRRCRTSLEIAGLAPEVCFAAAHPERPGRETLIHWDADEFAALHRWGNRKLAAHGGELRFAAPGPAESALTRVWSRGLRPLNVGGGDGAEEQ